MESLAGTEGVAKAVEAGKSQFAGTEIQGKKLGVIGLGAIGGAVANTAVHLGMTVIGCDPFMSVEAAWNMNHHVVKAATFDDVFKVADYITLHVPATKDTKGMINAESLAKMKKGVKIINLARADLVDAAALKEALASGKVSAYVTDFPTEDILGVPGVVAIPHLGASTAEAEDNCAVMAAKELDDYLTNGNIRNSVNFPNASMPKSGDVRICILHSNVPNMITQITGKVSGCGLNIENMINASKGANAYTMLDISGEVPAAVLDELRGIEGVVRVRSL